MTESQRHLYSRSNAARILGIPWWEIEILAIHDDSIILETPEGHVSLTKQAFHAEFVRYRKEQSSSLLVHQEEGYYRITNPDNGHLSFVGFDRSRPTCDCPDWKKHHGACKHIYAVLNVLGYENLSDFLQTMTHESSCSV